MARLLVELLVPTGKPVLFCGIGPGGLLSDFEVNFFVAACGLSPSGQTAPLFTQAVKSLMSRCDSFSLGGIVNVSA